MTRPGNDPGALIEAVIADLPDLDASHLVATTRLRDHVYKVQLDNQVIVVKLFSPGRRHAAQREAAGLHATAPLLGARVPHLLGHGHVAGTPYLVLAEAPGVTLRHALNGAELTEPDALRVLGRLLADLHQTGHVGFGPVTSPQHPTFADYFGQLTAHRATLLEDHGHRDIARTLARTTERITALTGRLSRSVLCHGDIHPDNVFIRSLDRAWVVSSVVDYESVAYAIPEYDLAKTLVVSSALDAAHRRTLLDAYDSRHTIDQTLLDHLLHYHAIDGWLWATIIEDRHHRRWNHRLKRVLSMGG